VLLVRVLCASAVRVGVCGGSVCVCLGALRVKKKKKITITSGISGGISFFLGY